MYKSDALLIWASVHTRHSIYIYREQIFVYACLWTPLALFYFCNKLYALWPVKNQMWWKPVKIVQHLAIVTSEITGFFCIISVDCL